jgi:hypothetical protein
VLLVLGVARVSGVPSSEGGSCVSDGKVMQGGGSGAGQIATRDATLPEVGSRRRVDVDLKAFDRLGHTTTVPKHADLALRRDARANAKVAMPCGDPARPIAASVDGGVVVSSVE